MTIDPVGFGRSNANTGASSFESPEAKARFGQLLNLVGQPDSMLEIDRPDMAGRLRQYPPGVYQFRVTQRGPKDSVTFSASTTPDGRFVERLQFGQGGTMVTPSQPMAQELFLKHVVNPLHDFLFGEKGRLSASPTRLSSHKNGEAVADV